MLSIGLMTTAIIVLMSNNVGDDNNGAIDIPFLGLEMEKFNGIEIFVLLGTALFCRFAILLNYASRIEAMHNLTPVTEKEVILLRPPSIGSYMEILENVKWRSLLRSGFLLFYLLVLLFVGVYVGAHQFAIKDKFPMSWINTTVLDLILLGVSVCCLVDVRRRRGPSTEEFQETENGCPGDSQCIHD